MFNEQTIYMYYIYASKSDNTLHKIKSYFNNRLIYLTTIHK